MSDRKGGADPELTALIEEVIAAELLKADSAEIEIAHFVAEHGQASLDPERRRIWEARVLPIVSRPLREQIAIASILRRGGYVPRKIKF